MAADKVFVTGYSNGGYMAIYLACKAASTFSGLGLVGALAGIDPACGTDCLPQTLARYLAWYSTSDPDVAYAGGGSEYYGVALAQLWASRQGCSTSSITSYQHGVFTCKT